jgi:type I restriction enzyme M protein
MPPASNANYAWLQHMIYHLSPHGVMACVLANGSLSSQTNNEGDIRKSLIEHDLVDCIVALPKQLFYNTGIPACIWFISRKRIGNGDRKRTGEILFIDASEIGHMADKTHREFSEEDMAKVAGTYHEWRKQGGEYKDIKGFCKSADMAEITKHNFVLTPGRYVGIQDEIDDGIPFADKIAGLTTKLAEQMAEEKKLDEEIKTQLKNIGFNLE